MSAEAIKIRRRNNFNLLREARQLASFDDVPLLPADVDPQLHVSNNTVDQPFDLRGGKDMVLAQYSGSSRLEFTSGPVRYFDLNMGDFVYVPAGAVHRILTREPGIQLRYKAVNPGQETVSWSCKSCGQSLFEHSFDASGEPAQLGYQQACEQFNADATLRQCSSCGAEHPPVELEHFRWQRVAESLLAGDKESEQAQDH